MHWEWPWQLRAAAGFGAAGAQWGPSAPPGEHSPSLLSVLGTESSSQFSDPPRSIGS